LALSRQKKEQLVKEYGERLARAQVAIWAHYQGLTVAQATDLRRQLREAGAEAVVVKNTLIRRALEEADLPVSDEMRKGPCLVTFIYDDVAPAAKVVADFARQNEEILQIIGGLIGGQLATVEQIQSLTTLPSREVLLAQVVGGIQAPISGFVGTLAAIMRGLLNVLDARARQLEGSEA